MENNTAEDGGLNSAVSPAKELWEENLFETTIRHQRIIISTIIFFLIAAVFYLSKATPVYTSTARLYVEQTGPKIISDLEGVMTRSNNYLYTQAELIKSTPIIIGVADDPQMKHFKTFAKIDNIIGFLKKALNVTVGKKDDIIAISFDSPYPVEASQVVNSIVDSYVSYHSSRKRNTVFEVLKILQKEKVKRDKELSDKFQEMLDFTRANGVVSFDSSGGGHVVFQRLVKLSEALTEAQLAGVSAKADYEAASRMTSMPAKIKQLVRLEPAAGIGVFANDEGAQLRSELKNLEVELKDAKYQCTEKHPSIKKIRAEIGRIRLQINQQKKEFAQSYVEIMKQRWLMAKQREDELAASFDTQQKMAQDIGIKATEYSVLQAELKRTEKLCDILDDRIKELSVTEDAGALNITVLEVAHPADHPSKPQKAKVIAMALIMGLIFGFSLAIIRDWMDYRLRSAEEISAILGVPVLGIVPTILERQSLAEHSRKMLFEFKPTLTSLFRNIRNAVSSSIQKEKIKTFVIKPPLTDDLKLSSANHLIKNLRKTWSQTKAVISATPRICRAIYSNTALGLYSVKAVASASKAPVGGLKMKDFVSRGQNVHLKPKSIVAEAYRTIRTAIFFGVPKDEAKTILITSPAPGEGKSTLVSNLAFAMAQAGQKTIVVDCDFRRPMQHNIFEISREKGISSVIVGTSSLSEAIQHGPVNDLDILTCGSEVPNPSELLNSNSFSTVLHKLSEQYDRVIIDSPPVTSVADSQILGAICDITLLVLRAEKSTRRLSQHAKDSLISVGGHLLGAVVNDVHRKHNRYGYDYYAGYGYYGHYGYGHKEKEGKKEQEKVYA